MTIKTKKFDGKVYLFTHIYYATTPMKTIETIVSRYKENGYLVRVVKDMWIPNEGWQRSIYIRRKYKS
jgi:hypothetical protein